MMKKLLILFLALAATCTAATAQEKKTKEKKVEVPQYTDEFLDTVKFAPKPLLNDYTIVGVEYGISQSYMLFTPDFNRKPVRFPDTYGVFITRYGKMVGTMPYFGITFGLMYGHEGYEFKADEETGYIATIEGATKVTYDVIEAPLMIAGHVDMNHSKLMIDLGPYAGYRMNIHREGQYISDPDLVNNFTDYDRKIEYGLNGGVGFAALFDPLEFHIKLRARYSWSTIFEPDYYNHYYYRYGYPLDFMLTAGVYFQLTKRYGKTKTMLRREARERIFNPSSQTEQ